MNMKSRKKEELDGKRIAVQFHLFHVHIEVFPDATKSDLCDFFHDLAYSGYSHEKYSTLVRKDGRLLGICLCSSGSRGENTNMIPSHDIDVLNHDFAEEIAKGPYKQHKANQLVSYVSALERGLYNLPGNFITFLKIDIICVANHARGQGLGKRMTLESIKIARSQHCEWIVTAATASASQVLFSRVGFETFFKLPYSIFRENGRVVFDNLYDGCSSGKLMALQLNK
ncbi:acetyltransferase, GNAT family [Dictyocaulus viviparus]|uniref:Acetyltransferase, GNAT family n=1 Tax=Dictyocaulus viviparus TaxID=29172 RepID=A0A0D8XJ00_DICVI|nr:acetyltransferase, GNAT family [Dictyocaulus viviparus]